MTTLLSHIVPRNQIIVFHAPLGEVEWSKTIAHIEYTIPPSMPLILAHTASGKTLLERVEERGLWPGVCQRYCTGDLKRTPIERELRRYLKAHPRFQGRLINAMGLRRDESRDRARRKPWRRNERMSVAGREVFDWLPVFDLTTERRLPHHRRVRSVAPPGLLVRADPLLVLVLRLRVAIGLAPRGRAAS